MKTDEYNIRIKVEPMNKKKLCLYNFDKVRKTWARSNIDSGYKRKNIDSIKNLKMITWNILGALKYEDHELFAFSKRSQEVNKILKNLDLDIICLQEVSKKWINFFLEQEWLREMYFCSEKDADRVHSCFGLSNVVFSKIPLHNIYAYDLISLQMDVFLNFDIFINNIKYSIGTFQLQSTKQYTDFRIVQLKTIFEIVKDQKNVILLGDWNFGDNYEEEMWIENRFVPLEYKDVWLELYPNDPGYTEDTEINKMRLVLKNYIEKKERFDKVLYNSSLLHPVYAKIIGKEPVEDSDKIWPSDHWGLIVDFEIKLNLKL